MSAYTNSRTEEAAELITWGADEHVLLAIAACWWLYCRGGYFTQRRISDHILLTTLAVSLIPHLLKSVVDQRRPDRLTVRGHLHGVPFSGKSRDAFPSGHAMHVGALASAATVLPTAKRNVAWAFGAGACFDPGGAARALGERRGRRARARRHDRTAAPPVHRLRRGKPPRPVKAEGRVDGRITRWWAVAPF